MSPHASVFSCRESEAAKSNAWITSQGAKATVIYFNVGSTRVSSIDHSLLAVLHQFCGLFSAGYVAIQLNQLFSWWEDDAGEAIPIDAATNYIALFALVLNGCFCGTFLVKMIVFLREVETSKTWKWLTSDASHPYHVWLVAGVVALFLDYAATRRAWANTRGWDIG